MDRPRLRNVPSRYRSPVGPATRIVGERGVLSRKPWDRSDPAELEPAAHDRGVHVRLLEAEPIDAAREAMMGGNTRAHPARGVHLQTRVELHVSEAEEGRPAIAAELLGRFIGRRSTNKARSFLAVDRGALVPMHGSISRIFQPEGLRKKLSNAEDLRLSVGATNDDLRVL